MVSCFTEGSDSFDRKNVLVSQKYLIVSSFLFDRRNSFFNRTTAINFEVLFTSLTEAQTGSTVESSLTVGQGSSSLTEAQTGSTVRVLFNCRTRRFLL